MKKLLSILVIGMLVIVLGACGSQGTESLPETSQADDAAISNVAVYEDTQAEILDAEFYETEDGASVVRVNFKYTNNSEDGLYMLESFVVRAFQNDTQLDDMTDINEETESGNSAELIREVKNGESVEGSYVFQLSDDSEVEVRVCTPTADEELLAQKVFSK